MSRSVILYSCEYGMFLFIFFFSLIYFIFAMQSKQRWCFILWICCHGNQNPLSVCPRSCGLNGKCRFLSCTPHPAGDSGLSESWCRLLVIIVAVDQQDSSNLLQEICANTACLLMRAASTLISALVINYVLLMN